VVRNLPKDLAAICTKGLQRETGRRLRDGGGVRADLRHWLCDEPTGCPARRAPRGLWLWSRRNKGWAAAIGAVLLALLGFAVGALGYAEAAERATARPGMRPRPSEEATKAAKREAEAAKREAEVAGRQVVMQQLLHLGWHSVDPAGPDSGGN